MSERTRYDTIGKGYAQQRRPEPRWERQIHEALGDARTVVNVGAGTGNYEPADRIVVAVEPSRTMIAQRLATAAPAICAVAESLPIADRSFEAATALLTVHHWVDVARGLAELRRVASRQVITLFDHSISQQFWLFSYFPETYNLRSDVDAPTATRIARHLDVVDVQILQVPHDCVDGVAAAHWRRPDAYLDPAVQRSISSLALISAEARERGTKRLEQDLKSGTWNERWGHLLDQTQADFGYRLVVCESC